MGRVVVRDTVDVAVLAGDERGARRGAEGVHDEGVAEADALGGEAVEVRRAQPWEAGALALLALDDAERVPALVVGEDVDEVGRALAGAREAGPGQEQEAEGHA